MDQIRALITEMRESEKIQLLEHSNRTRTLAQSTIAVAEAGSALAVVIVLVMGTIYRWGLTLRRRTEHALQESLAKQALVIRALPVVIYSSRASGDFAALWVSDNIEKVSGFPGGALLKDTNLWVARRHPDDRERVFQEFQRLPEVGTLNVEYRWQVADGTYRWFLDQAVLQRTPDGQAKEILGLWLDITERNASLPGAKTKSWDDPFRLWRPSNRTSTASCEIVC
jgi:PAS domain-containing protein